MQKIINPSPSETHIVQDDVFFRMHLFFDEFPHETWLPALLKILKNYTTPKYQTWQEALEDEDVQLFTHLLALLDDLHPAFQKPSSIENYPLSPDISPNLPAA